MEKDIPGGGGLPGNWNPGGRGGGGSGDKMES